MAILVKYKFIILKQMKLEGIASQVMVLLLIILITAVMLKVTAAPVPLNKSITFAFSGLLSHIWSSKWTWKYACNYNFKEQTTLIFSHT